MSYNTEFRTVFEKYAQKEINGRKYMTPENFVIDYLKLFKDQEYNKNTLDLIAGIVDTSKDGLISFEEFVAFEHLLNTPDALYALTFQLFDQIGNGYISFENFKNVYSHTVFNDYIAFNFDTPFIKRHFGAKNQRKINYAEFTQMIRDIQDEHAMQAFNKFDTNRDGSISIYDFHNIMLFLKTHLLSDYLRENLLSVVLQGEKHRRISFSYFVAFINLINHMETAVKIFQNVAAASEEAGGPFAALWSKWSRWWGGDASARRRATPNGPEISRAQFLHEAQKYSRLTPLEVNLLFELIELERSDGLISMHEIEKLMPSSRHSLTEYYASKQLHQSVAVAGGGGGVSGVSGRSPVGQFLMATLEQMYRFTLGSVAGALGATAVFPIDLVKTRMQNQRSGSMVGELMYKNSWDCFKKVLRYEGFFGLYRGLPPQILGVAPEKAIKLTVNDLIKDNLGPVVTPADGSGKMPLWVEILAGGTAGFCQVVFTNPLEIVKIRLQVAGELAGTSGAMKRVSAVAVMRELGPLGLYKGATACVLRDAPFSAIYFPLYAHLKAKFADPTTGHNTPLSLLVAGTLAGPPAASLVTPADVIKTRLQVKARTGQAVYHGIPDAARKIWAQEGGRAFWKGAMARVFRSSPQFGVTLFTYEMLQRYLGVDFGTAASAKAAAAAASANLNPLDKLEPITSNAADLVGGYRIAGTLFQGMENKFGLCLPKFQLPITENKN